MSERFWVLVKEFNSSYQNNFKETMLFTTDRLGIPVGVFWGWPEIHWMFRFCPTRWKFNPRHRFWGQALRVGGSRV